MLGDDTLSILIAPTRLVGGKLRRARAAGTGSNPFVAVTTPKRIKDYNSVLGRPCLPVTRRECCRVSLSSDPDRGRVSVR